MKSYPFTNKVFAITDLVRVIGDFKHDFERASDIEYLSANNQFQHLVYHIFNNICDSSMLIRNLHNSERLAINICVHKKPYIVVRLGAFHKYKRLPFYIDILFLDTEKSPIFNQRQVVANNILSDEILLPFFQSQNVKLICK